MTKRRFEKLTALFKKHPSFFIDDESHWKNSFIHKATDCNIIILGSVGNEPTWVEIIEPKEFEKVGCFIYKDQLRFIDTLDLFLETIL